MKNAMDQFSKISTSIIVKVFKNEMIMIHTSKFINYFKIEDYSLENIYEKLKESLSENKDCVSLKEFGELTSIKNQLLAKILIEEMLEFGLLVVDESDLDLRYYLNKFILYK